MLNRRRVKSSTGGSNPPLSAILISRVRLILNFCLFALAVPLSAAPKTWALAVGVSQYQKLPQNLWLQYAAADAESFARYLMSPSAGSVPASQILLLTDRKATTSALRAAFREFLKTGPAREDTIYIMIAGHGVVDAQGAWILTWDSDPQNLPASALSMAELRAAVEQELGIAARVVFLADMCRAATIAGQKSSSIAGTIEQLGEVQGQMLGLMASRPKELSNEGPQFGGGHGAFTDAVLRGLNGAADADRDGSVTAGELIDFVTADVPKTTGGAQHPRDFGNMDSTVLLSHPLK